MMQIQIELFIWIYQKMAIVKQPQIVEKLINTGKIAMQRSRKQRPIVSNSAIDFIHSHVTWETTKKRLMVNLYWPSAAFVCPVDHRHKKQT